MNLDLVGFIVASIAALVFFVTEWVWPYERPDPFRDLVLNSAAAIGMMLTSAATVAVVTITLQRIAPVPPASWPTPIRIVLFVLATDACRYVAHRLMHRPGWWRVHRFHHSVDVVNWFSGMRASPVHVMLFMAPIPVLAWLLQVDEVTQAANLTAMALSNHLMHTNTRIPDPVQRALEWVLVTPRFHRAHHSVDPSWRESNFAAMFTIWDRLFGTYFDPDRLRGKVLSYGLGESAPLNWPRTAIGL